MSDLKHGISAVVITKNEEKNIERCILSLKDTVDEIIIIDSGSTDRTEEICKQYGVRFEKVEWQGYSDTKNYGNGLAQYSYILSIDADEALSDDLKTTLLKEKKEGFSADAYSIAILVNYCGSWIKHCGWYPARKLRMWHKEKGNWEGSIHEAVKMDEGTSIKVLKGDLLHYSYYTIDDHYRQIDHYTELMAQNNINKGKKAGWVQLYLSSAFKFFQSYFIRLGILDGSAGFTVCRMSAYATYRKYLRTIELQKELK